MRELAHTGDVPAIVFVFGREQCFEIARLLKSCRRFTTDEEGAKIEAAATRRCCRGAAKELRPLLQHGIGIHHAGILPRYKQLVEQLALERLIKFVVSTETIAAGINLPAKRVVFPSLRKFIKQKARLMTAAEYHQMAGRAGRPQFDTEGIAITLAPEEVVQEVRKELKELQKGKYTVDEAKIRRAVYTRQKADAQRSGGVSWDPEVHGKLVGGQPLPLRSKTVVTADQILAMGLPDLATEPLKTPSAEALPAGPEAEAPAKAADAAPASAPAPATEASDTQSDLPPSMNLNIRTVIDHLFVDDRTKQASRKRLEMLVENLQALGILDEHGQHKSGQMIRQLRGIDGPFVYYCLKNHDLPYVMMRELCEYLVDHDAIQKLLSRKDDDKRWEWIRKGCVNGARKSPR